MKKAFKWILFISSYIPLFIILIIKNIDFKKSLNSVAIILNGDISCVLKNSSYSDFYLWLLAFICIFSIAMLAVIFSHSKEFTRSRIITNIESNNNAIFEYFVTYLLALSNSSTNLRDIIIFWIILLIIGYLYIKNNMFCINPTLHILFRYNIYKISYTSSNSDASTNEGFVLSKLDDYEFNSYKNKKVDLIPLSGGFNNSIFIYK